MIKQIVLAVALVASVATSASACPNGTTEYTSTVGGVTFHDCHRDGTYTPTARVYELANQYGVHTPELDREAEEGLSDPERAYRRAARGERWW